MDFSRHALSRLLPGALVADRSVLGIDIGSSSIKIVELRGGSGTPHLETYGSIALTSRTPDIAAASTSSFVATALLDLVHEVGAISREGGMSLPFSSTFVTIIDSLKREGAKARELIEAEARQYVPVDLGTVSLVWQEIPDAVAPEGAFVHAERMQPEAPHKHKLLLVAVRNDVLSVREHVAYEAGMSISFFETELFSAVRAGSVDANEPALFIDLGAAGSKIYIVDENGIARATRYLAGGKDVYETARQMVRELPAAAPRRCVLLGGGALIQGAAEKAQRALSLPVELADPFARVQGPIVLEDVLKRVGPLYTVACGLALRALQ